jgi:hypothetical protein
LWHHARFDLESGCTFDLWADDAPIFSVELRNGQVWVKTTLGHANPAAHWRQRLADGLHMTSGLSSPRASTVSSPPKYHLPTSCGR